ncbi:MAG: 50S ribosomal protein L4 [Candidatus Zixiibacteriota bacterium]
MNVKVYNQEGVEVGSVELKPELFGVEPNEAVVHQYVVTYLANQRQGTHQTKTRKEVRGGGKKPFKQKGTGQARMGTTRSPLRRGGGTIFGPHPRDYSAKVPRQMKRLALQSVFSDKARKECIKVLDKIEMSEAKTKAVVGMLTKLAVAGKKCLILDEGKNETVQLSCRNLSKVTYQRASLANGYEVLNADYVIFTKAGLAKAEEVFA